MAFSSRSFIRVVAFGFWIPILIAIVASIVVVQIHQNDSTRFISLARLVAGGRMVSASTSGPQYAEYMQDFYGTIIETLESAELRKNAKERVQALYPDMRPSAVELKVTQNKGSAIFNVAAIGSEPKFTRMFLDALLDEFRAFREQIREQQRNKAINTLVEDVVKRESRVKELSTKVAELETVELTVARAKSVALSEALAGLIKQQALGQGQADTDLRIGSITSELHRANALVRVADSTQAELQNATRLYQEMFDLVQRVQVNEEMSGDYVHIMERASPAIEDIIPWWTMIFTPALLGASAGVGILLLVALLLANRPPASIPLPPPVPSNEGHL